LIFVIPEAAHAGPGARRRRSANAWRAHFALPF
jgi:hypothetical protein